MPAKKKTKKKKQIAKRIKPKAAKKKSLKAKTTGRKTIAAKTRKPAKKKAKKVAAKRRSAPVAAKRRSAPREFPVKEPEAQSGRLAGDLQGLSHFEDAESESVAELVEEGNAFEAGILSGVEAADTEDEGEVETHEVPEDDVPGEYLDED
jgi:hypothetical protein